MNDGFSRGLFWILDLYSKTTAIVADHLKIDTSRLLKKLIAGAIFLMGGRRRRLLRSERCQTLGFGDHFASFSRLQADSSRRRQNFGDANEVVGGRGQYEEPLHQVSSSMACLAQPADGLDPAERLLDPLALDRADAIAGMTGGARIDGRTAIGVVLRDMRRAATFATAGNKLGSVIILVGSDRAARLGVILDHVERGRPLRGAVGLGQSRIDDQAVAVLRHQMAHVAELGLLAGAFAEQPGVRVGGRRMGVILSFLAVEIALGVAPAVAPGRRRFAVAILRHKTLHAGPGLNQRAIDRE